MNFRFRSFDSAWGPIETLSATEEHAALMLTCGWRGDLVP